MKFWDEFNKWFENLIFPKTDDASRRFQKKLAINQILASALISLGASLAAVGLSFKSLTLTTYLQSVSLEELEGEKASYLVSSLRETSDLIDKLSDDIMWAGIGVLIFGVIYMMAVIIREK